MNKFLKNLSNADNRLLVQRAVSVNSRGKMAFEQIINKIKMAIEEKKIKLEDLTDMGPETTTSLSPAASDWSPETWVNQIVKIKAEIYDLAVQLKCALEVYDELFEDVDEKGEGAPLTNKTGKGAK